MGESGDSSSVAGCTESSASKVPLEDGERISAASSSSVASGISLIEKPEENCLSCVRISASLLLIADDSSGSVASAASSSSVTAA